MSFAYLIPTASSKEIVAICEDAIEKYTPGKILKADRAEFPHWSEAFKWLFENCPAEVGVFMDDDCILLSDISELIKGVEDGKWMMVAVEGKIPYPDGRWLRWCPGYYEPNFMILNVKKFKEQFGNEGIAVDMEMARKEIPEGRSIEMPYGISQKLRGYPIKNLIAETTKYGMATTYGADGKKYAIHLWYGAWKHRGAYRDGLSVEELARREKLFCDDYLSGQLQL